MPWRYRRGLRGTARQVQVREGPGRGFSARPEDYLSFRLEVTDERGDVVEEVPVELSAPAISGRVLRDGDRVVVLGRRTRRGLVKPKGIWVIGSQLEIRGGGGRQYGFFANILALPLGLAFIAAWPMLIYGLWTGRPEFVILAVLTMIVYWALYIRR